MKHHEQPVVAISADPIEAIRHNLRSAAEALLEAGKIYVREVQAEPMFRSRLRNAIPELTAGFLAALEKVGLGALDPRVLYDGCPCPTLVAHLPPSEQRRLIEKPVDLADEQGGSQTLWFRDLSVFQARQILSTNGIRGVAEQVSYLKSLRIVKSKKSMDQSRQLITKDNQVASVQIDTKRGRVMIASAPVTFTADDLRALIKEIENVQR